MWSRSTQDRYGDPGSPVTRLLPNGERAILQNGDWIFGGNGASPEGDRPFLDRFNLQTQKSERLFRSEANQYEAPVALLDDNGSKFITRLESTTAAPNFYVRTSGQGSNPIKALTNFPDPTPQLRGIKKQLVTYKRQDGCSVRSRSIYRRTTKKVPGYLQSYGLIRWNLPIPGPQAR